MKIQTVFVCTTCGERIEYDDVAKCYLNHAHPAGTEPKLNPDLSPRPSKEDIMDEYNSMSFYARGYSKSWDAY